MVRGHGAVWCNSNALNTTGPSWPSAARTSTRGRGERRWLRGMWRSWPTPRSKSWSSHPTAEPSMRRWRFLLRVMMIDSYWIPQPIITDSHDRLSFILFYWLSWLIITADYHGRLSWLLIMAAYHDRLLLIIMTVYNGQLWSNIMIDLWFPAIYCGLKSHKIDFPKLACGIVVVLREGGCHRSGGHFRGIINHWGKAAARGEGDSPEDVRIFFSHHQGSGS